MKVVDIFESDLYDEDINFEADNPDLTKEESNELKDIHYTGDFWVDCDYVYSKGFLIGRMVMVGEEIIIDYVADELPDDLEQQLINFYDNEIDDSFIYLNNGMFCSKKRNIELWKEMKDSYIGISYRGGSGYSYGFHKYNKKGE